MFWIFKIILLGMQQNYRGEHITSHQEFYVCPVGCTRRY